MHNLKLVLVRTFGYLLALGGLLVLDSAAEAGPGGRGKGRGHGPPFGGYAGLPPGHGGLPPGLAKKPYGLPPGQAKKFYGSSYGAGQYDDTAYGGDWYGGAPSVPPYGSSPHYPLPYGAGQYGSFYGESQHHHYGSSFYEAGRYGGSPYGGVAPSGYVPGWPPHGGRP